MTQLQITRLRLAVQKARAPGGCKYLNRSDEPVCVIAQLAALEGIPADTMQGWRGHVVGSLLRDLTRFGASPLGSYPNELLQDLQAAWDSNLLYEGDARDQMWRILTEHVKYMKLEEC
jgi:hypothetical protein